MGRNLDYEQYLYGSSDYPRTRWEKLSFGKRNSLEKKIEKLNIRILCSDDSINVEETNKKRLDLIIKLNLRPVIKYCESIKYRIVDLDNNGLISVSYSNSIHYNFLSLFDNELITYDVAAEYLGLNKDKIRNYVKDGLITGISKRVFLKDVNKLKTNLNPHSNTMLCPASKTM